MKWNSQFNAVLNIMRTLFIVVALAAATLLFNRDSDRLVLRPIERMIKKASKPLSVPQAVTGQILHQKATPQLTLALMC